MEGAIVDDAIHQLHVMRHVRLWLCAVEADTHQVSVVGDSLALAMIDVGSVCGAAASLTSVVLRLALLGLLTTWPPHAEKPMHADAADVLFEGTASFSRSLFLNALNDLLLIRKNLVAHVCLRSQDDLAGRVLLIRDLFGALETFKVFVDSCA